MTDEAQCRDPGEPPVLDWVDKVLIDVDPSYQRALDVARVQRIIEGFAWDSFGAIVIAPAEDGRFHCIDGQHRLDAAKQHSKVTVVPAIIIAGRGAQIEADTFVTVNRNRKNISALDLYWAEIAAGDPDAQTVAQVCERAGIVMRRYTGNNNYAVGETLAIGAVRSLVDRRGALRARQIFEVLSKARLAPITATQIRAAELLLTDPEYCNDIDAEGLTEAIAGKAPVLEDEAKVFAPTHRTSVVKAFASVWFKRSRKKRRAA